MEAVTRNVRDIDLSERRVLEHVLGQRLQDNQQVIVQIVPPDQDAEAQQPHARLPAGQLPDWCRVFAGLSDDEVAEAEGMILQRVDLSRASE
jgi:hypothetical protein